MKFTIYHSIQVNPSTNEKEPYTKVGEVLAENLYQTFHLTQNFEESEWSKNNHRSTSVGDIVFCHTTNTYNRVAGVGWEEDVKCPNILSSEKYEEYLNYLETLMP